MRCRVVALAQDSTGWRPPLAFGNDPWRRPARQRTCERVALRLPIELPSQLICTHASLANGHRCPRRSHDRLEQIGNDHLAASIV
jgi:hypothetical protein